MGVARRALAAFGGVAGALTPVAARAQEGGRTLEPAGDFWAAILLTCAGVLAVIVLAVLVYLYRRARGLEWDFQRPDPEPHNHH